MAYSKKGFIVNHRKAHGLWVLFLSLSSSLNAMELGEESKAITEQRYILMDMLCSHLYENERGKQINYNSSSFSKGCNQSKESNNGTSQELLKPTPKKIEQDISRADLIQQIIELTGAQPDPCLNARYSLQKVLGKHLEVDTEFRNKWDNLWSKLIEPERLINKEGCEGDLKLNDIFLFPEIISSEFDTIKKEIHSFKGLLAQLLPQYLEGPILMDKVAALYEDFLIDIHTACLAPTESPDEILESKALLMGECLPEPFYRISQARARYILGYNKNRREAEHLSPNGTHRVTFLPSKDHTHVSRAYPESKTVYFKSDGFSHINPSREYMLFSLYNKLGIEIPTSALLLLDAVQFERKEENHYEGPFFLQASQGIAGPTGKEVLEGKNTLELDGEHFSRQVLGVLLTCPEDGKADNFIVTPGSERKWGWVSIDNDHVITSPLGKFGEGVLKSVLLTFPAMHEAISPSTLNLINNVDPKQLIREWLETLQIQAARYQHLKDILLWYARHQIHGRRDKDGLLSERYLSELWRELSLPFLSFKVSVPHTISALLYKAKAFVREKEIPPTLWELFAYCYPNISKQYKAFLDEGKTANEVFSDIKYTAEPLKATFGSDASLVEENYFRGIPDWSGEGPEEELFMGAAHYLSLPNITHS